MTSRSAYTRLFRELEARYGAAIAEAFLEAIADIRSRAQVGQIIEALERGDIEAAFEALNLDQAAYDQMLEQIRAAYQEGGRAAADALPRRQPNGAALVFRFDARNLAAEDWLARHSSNLITRIVEDQRSAVRTALTESLAEGANPRTAALRVVGRISRATGRREGGILGLTAAQERAVASARAQLLSGDRGALRAYLTRAKRDRRFDRSVARVIRDGGRLNPEAVERAVQSYSNRLLKYRGDLIGRIETLTALNAASHEAARQLVESGKVTAAQVRRVWRSASDARVRHTHRALNAESVGLDEAFVSPSGARLRFPGDTSLGAPASEIVNCRCVVENRIDFLANLE